MNVKRNIKLDNIKGIMIILTVFAHILLTYRYVEINKYNNIVKFIYTFHMPIFFIISGELSYKISFKRIINYIILFLLMHLSFIIYNYFDTGAINILSITYSSWFLLLIILYRFIFSINIIKKIFTNKIISIITIFFLLLVGFVNFNNLLISRFFYFLIFFIIGYLFKKNINDKKINYIYLIIAIIVLFLLSQITNINIFMGETYISIINFIIRVFTIIFVVIMYYSLKNIIINKNILLLTKSGYYSLYIYLIHRIPTLIISNYFYINKYFIFIAIISTIIICIITIAISKYIEVIINKNIFKYLVITTLIILFIFSLTENKEISIKEQSKLDDYISIGYVGDLILLEDQLKNSNNNFEYLFKNMKPYFDNTDYLIGVLEGPVDDNSEYSYGNFDDDKELKLNYPTSFLKSIKNYGFDLVSISNNHILDRGISAYNNTINNLNDYKINYVGEHNKYKIVNIKGLKVGVLAYTYGLNYYEDGYKKVTNYLTKPSSKDYLKVKENIVRDFKKLKKNNVDLIIVMPHYGTQFSKKIDTYQETYNRLFVNLGADIILGDHVHAIQPIEYYKNSVIINCPGNYINSYIKEDGDISMFTKIYINKNKRIEGVSITPIVAQKNENNLYYPTLLNKNNPHSKRVKEIIGEIIFKTEVKETKNTYYYFKNKKYKYDNKYNFKLTNKDKNTILYKEIKNSNKVCFIGDSITEGTKNNYHPWYEVLMSNFKDKEVINISKGSYTTDDIIKDFKDEIINSNCDLTIINIGTNDIRYNTKDVKDYIKNMKEILSYIEGKKVVLAPWETTKRDYNIDIRDTKKRKLYKIYDEKLKKLDNIIYINPNPYIKKVLSYNGECNYLIDGIHPNTKEGIKLYSYSVLRSGDFNEIN